MELQDYIDRIFDVAILGKRHLYYEKKEAIQKWLLSINKGKYQDDWIVAYRDRETQAQKEQRIRVYNSRTPRVANKARSLFNEVHRTDDISEVLEYSGGDETIGKKQSLIDQSSNFYGNISAREYLDKMQPKKAFYDPNAWMVVEWHNDGLDAENNYYPYVVAGVDVVDFKYDYGTLDYVIVRQSVKAISRTSIKPKDVYVYTLYGVGYSIKMYPDIGEYRYEQDPGEVNTLVKETKSADYTVYENLLDEVQAYPFGYIEDEEYNDFIKISPLHYSKTGFDRLINRTSTLDISIACHGFLQKFIYAMPCNNHLEIDGVDYECDDGFCGSKKCPSCQGSGMQIHTSDQDVVYIKLPTDPEIRVEPLSSLVYYAQIDHQTVEMQRLEVEDAMSDCLSTIFNENIFERSEVTTTATENLLNWRSVYNTLAPYADHDSQMYEFIIRIIAKASGINKGLVHSFEYPSDFHMESVQELITLVASIPEGKLAPEILQSINFQIVKKLTTNDPTYLENYKAKESFRPFIDIPTSQLFILLDSLPEDHPKKTLYYNFTDIFEDILNEHSEFGLLTYDKQKDIVSKKVEEYKGNLITEPIDYGA